MSARALTWCWLQRPRTPTQKLVLAALADRADDDGYCFPSLRWLADKCEPVSAQSAKRAVAELEKQLLLVKVERKRRTDGTLGTWLYRLPLDQGSPVIPGDIEADEVATGDDARGHERPVGQGSPVIEPEVTGELAETSIETTKNVSPVGETGARALVAHFVDECRRVIGRDPMRNAVERMGRHVKDLLKQGAADETIRLAITELVEQGREVGAIFALADQVHRGGYRGTRRSAGGLDARGVMEVEL